MSFLFSTQSQPNRSVTDEETIRSSFAAINRNGRFVFVTTTVENRVSHKYVFIEAQKSLFRSLFLYEIRLGIRLHRQPQLGKFMCIKIFFREPSKDMSMSCSGSKIISYETMLAANGCLMHSNFETWTSLKYNAKTVSAKHRMKRFLF
jgi:hypothetical protein